MSKSKKQFDSVEIYCPMLGHGLNFKYCRTMDLDSPCSRILDCWFERLPIQQYMGDHYTTDEQKQVFKPLKPKMTALADIVTKVQDPKE